MPVLQRPIPFGVQTGHIFRQDVSMNFKFGQWRTQDLKKGGVVVEGDHQKGGGVREGDVPPPALRAEAFENVNSVC